jgi:hypothetical protein
MVRNEPTAKAIHAPDPVETTGGWHCHSQRNVFGRSLRFLKADLLPSLPDESVFCWELADLVQVVSSVVCAGVKDWAKVSPGRLSPLPFSVAPSNSPTNREPPFVASAAFEPSMEAASVTLPLGYIKGAL